MSPVPGKYNLRPVQHSSCLEWLVMRCFVLLLILAFLAQAAFALPESASTAVPATISSGAQEQSSLSTGNDAEMTLQVLDRQTLIELVKLAEFNVRYQQAMNHIARWRNLVYPLAQEGCYAGFLAYSVTDIRQRYVGWNNPRLMSSTASKRALSAATVGALLGSTSSAVELLSNGVATVQADRNGFSQQSSLSVVQSALERVDKLLARRTSLMNEVGVTGERRELLELKGQLFKYERDRLVFEFKRWSVHSRGYAWYKNAFYIINIVVNLDRFAVTPLAYKSFTAKKCSGAIGPMLIPASFLAGLGPAMSSAVGAFIERYQSRRLEDKLPGALALSDEEARHKFERLAELLENSRLEEQKNQLAADLVHLREEKIGLDTLIFHEERKIQRIRRVAGQQSKLMPAVATAGIASGILSTLGYHAYRQQPLINSRLALYGDATIIPAESLALIATPAASIAALIYERNLKRNNEQPEQLLARRLADLKALETLLTKNSP